MTLAVPLGLWSSPFHLDVAPNPVTTWSKILSHRFGVPFGLFRKSSNHLVRDLETHSTFCVSLEPASEHMLRSSTVHESVISILRVNEVVDRDTFVNMFDTEASLKEGAADLGFNLTTGGLPHKREFARAVTAWKTAKIMAETKLQTDAVARAHGVPVTLLPCDWTSIMTEFKKNSAITLPTIDHQPNRCLRISPRS